MTARPNVLDRRRLNRTLLLRQMLLERQPLGVVEGVEHLVGMQAQIPNSPYVGLWSRLAGFRPGHLSAGLEKKRVVRTVLMRDTIHLVSARDCLRIRPILQPLLAKRFLGGTWGKALEGIDIADVVARARALLDEDARVHSELGALLQQEWPDYDSAALAYAARSMLPLVQLPPRGVWGRGGRVTLQSAETWLGKPLHKKPSPRRLVLRYLRAFGPATTADIRTWSGLTGVGDIVDEIRSQLRIVHDESGRKLLDVPDAPLAEGERDAPVRFLPEFDNVLLSHADRSRVIPDVHRRRVTHSLGKPMVLVDGMTAASWSVKVTRRTARLSVQPFVRLSKRSVQDIEREGHELLGLVAEEVEERQLEVSKPG